MPDTPTARSVEEPPLLVSRSSAFASDLPRLSSMSVDAKEPSRPGCADARDGNDGRRVQDRRLFGHRCAQEGLRVGAVREPPLPWKLI